MPICICSIDPEYQDVAEVFYSDPEGWLNSHYPSPAAPPISSHLPTIPSTPSHLVMYDVLIPVSSVAIETRNMKHRDTKHRSTKHRNTSEKKTALLFVEMLLLEATLGQWMIVYRYLSFLFAGCSSLPDG